MHCHCTFLNCACVVSVKDSYTNLLCCNVCAGMHACEGGPEGEGEIGGHDGEQQSEIYNVDYKMEACSSAGKACWQHVARSGFLCMLLQS